MPHNFASGMRDRRLGQLAAIGCVGKGPPPLLTSNESLRADVERWMSSSGCRAVFDEASPKHAGFPRSPTTSARVRSTGRLGAGLMATVSAATAAATAAAASATVSTAATTAVTAAARARRTFAGFIHCQRTSTHIASVESLHRRIHPFLGFHLDEAKAAGPSGLAIRDDFGRANSAVLGKHLF